MIPESTIKNRMMVGIRGHFGSLNEDVLAAAARSCLLMIFLHNKKVLNVNNSAFMTSFIANQDNRKAADSVVKSAAKLVEFFYISK